MKHNDILVIIVSFNSMKWIERCYNSLRKSTIPCDVITIDNGSTDGTQNIIREKYSEVQLIENNQNIGFGAANNIGLKKALDEGYDYVYLLNQDAWIMPNTFQILIETSKNNPDFGILSPIQLTADMKHLDKKFMFHVIGDCNKQNPYFIEDSYFNRLQDIYEVNFVMAAHWLITRQCIKIVGGFSPTFFLYGEDNNYIHRSIYWKQKVGIVGKALAVHDRGNIIWNEQKNHYIEYYVSALRDCSNPNHQQNIWNYIRTNIKIGLINHNKSFFIYAFRLFLKRKDLFNNYKSSLQKCAFLTHY